MKRYLLYIDCLSALLAFFFLSACADVEEEGDPSQRAGEMAAGELSEGAGEEVGGEIGGEDQEDQRGGLMLVDPEVEPPPPPYEHPEYAQNMLLLVNQFRASGGTCGDEELPSVPPLRLNRLLNEAAREHAADMAANNYFAHESLDGRQPADRIRAKGYRGSNYGENIAAGNASADATFIQWKNSGSSRLPGLSLGTMTSQSLKEPLRQNASIATGTR